MSLPHEAATHLTRWLGDEWTAHPLAGDASVRAYYRVALPDGTTYMLAYYPEEVRAQLRRFLAAYEAVNRVRVSPRVGQVYQPAPREAGWKACPTPEESIVPEVLESSELAVLQRDVGDRTLFDVIAHHPYLLCHRDYHGQNIHVANDTLYVIDYQDLRMGPDTYDVASLLRDRGVAILLGDDVELELLEPYRAAVGADADIRRRYFETLLQRSIKILGTFSKQPITRGRMHYLDFIPATLESIRRCLDELPRYARLRDIFPLDFSVQQARERARSLNGQT